MNIFKDSCIYDTTEQSGMSIKIHTIFIISKNVDFDINKLYKQACFADK